MTTTTTTTTTHRVGDTVHTTGLLSADSHDEGRVLDIDDETGQLTIGWDSGVVSEADPSELGSGERSEEAAARLAALRADDDSTLVDGEGL